jgi:long-chain acyl-CoA synthetase
VLSLNHLFGRFGFLKSVVTGRTTAIVEATELEIDLNVVESFSATVISVVPRVMERMWNAMLEKSGSRKLWEQLEALDHRRAQQRALAEDERRQFDELRGALKAVARKALGGRIKYICYGAAAMPPRIMRFFELVGIPLIGSYGSTECGGVTLCGIDDNRPGNLGRPFPNVEVRIADDSEILVRGPTVTPGYFKNPEATREVLDPEGWFHTGDLGALDPDGALRMIGRKKDIFNCSDGSNIYPGYIELLLENDPLVRQAVLLGDRRPFIAALLVPDRKKIGETFKREDSELTDEEVKTVLEARVAEINGRLEHYERVREFIVLKEDFPPQVRSLNVFQKVKVDRRAVEERYRKEIAELYALVQERGAA